MRKIIPFTMVELILALGVCVIGICSIMVLFPVGANANRDAALETYAASAAEQLLHCLQYQLSEDWNTVADLPTGRPDLEEDGETEIAWGEPEDEVFANILPAENRNGLYLLRSVRGDEGDGSEGVPPPEMVDFQAILRVWRSDIFASAASNLGVRLNVEVSWPAELPYSARQKALYCLSVFNPRPGAAGE